MNTTPVCHVYREQELQRKYDLMKVVSEHPMKLRGTSRKHHYFKRVSDILPTKQPDS